MSYICDKKKEQHGDDLSPVADDAGVAVENLATVQEPEPEGKPPTEPVITEMDDDSMVYDDTFFFFFYLENFTDYRKVTMRR